MNRFKRRYAIRSLFLLFALLPAYKILSAQTPYAIGDAVEDFTYENLEGKETKLSASYAKSKGVILVFTSDGCPAAFAYQSRIISLHQRYASQGFPVLAMDPNAEGKKTSKDKEAKKLLLKHIPYEYVTDRKENSVYKLFGASKMPEVFVLVKKNDVYTLAYAGAIDDSPNDLKSVNKKYVEKAVNRLLLNAKVERPRVPVSVGCPIKKK